MDKIVLFEIKFDVNRTIYKPGDIVSGKCVIVLDNDINMGALYITIQGSATVSWTYSKENKFIIHSDSNVIFSQAIQLFSPESSNERKLKKGKHEITFATQIPSNICTSFNGKYGSIKYILKAHFISDISKGLFKKNNYKCSEDKFLKVQSPINIETSEYQTPIHDSIENSVCCFCCVTGPISIDAKLDKKAYYYGDFIDIKADFNNFSSHEMKPYATLYQLQTFIAPNDTKKIKKKLNKISDRGFHGRKILWTDKKLQIPDLTLSILNCPIIKIEYYLKIGLNFKGSNNIFVKIPVIISKLVDQPINDSNTRSLIKVDQSILLKVDKSKISSLKPKSIPNLSSIMQISQNNSGFTNQIYTIDAEENFSSFGILRAVIGSENFPPTYQQSIVQPPPYCFENVLMDGDEDLVESNL